jgi:mRNA interferase RelE/StbE
MFQVLFKKSVIKKDIRALSADARSLIGRVIKERLAAKPLDFGKPLKNSWRGHRSLRVSFYRIIYRVNVEEKTIIIVAIKNRKNAYEA